MTCSANYKWVILPRTTKKTLAGVIASWLILASVSAYKDGTATYCGYQNEVKAKEWVGGLVGLKRLLGNHTYNETDAVIKRLTELDYISFLKESNGKVKIKVKDLIIGDDMRFFPHTYFTAEKQQKFYCNDDSGFICIPRNLTQRLVETEQVFEEGDAYYDLWLHTVYKDINSPFSDYCPTILFDKFQSAITLDFLAKRWKWSKSKVSRFFKKHSDVYRLVKLQSSYGCVIFNASYQTDSEYTVPTQEEVFNVINTVKKRGEIFDAYYNDEHQTENEYINICLNSFSIEDVCEPFEVFEHSEPFETSVCQTDNLTNQSIKSKKNLLSFAYVLNLLFCIKRCVLQFWTYNILFLTTVTVIYIIPAVNIIYLKSYLEKYSIKLWLAVKVRYSKYIAKTDRGRGCFLRCTLAVIITVTILKKYYEEKELNS